MNPGRTICRLAVLLVLVASSMLLQTQAHAQQQRVEVQLSSNRVSVDESVILSVRAYGMDSDIDASALNKEFNVTNRSSSRQVTIENGKRTSLVEWVLELMPKSAGTLEIPPIIVGTEQSRPLTLLVEPPASGTDRDLYLEGSVDVGSPFVQAQVIYTLRVFQGVRFLDASLQVPEVDGVVMQQLSDEKNYQETVNGRNYVVSEIRYAVFPQKSGQVVIPPLTLQAVVPVNDQQAPNTRTRTRRITRRANEVELNVRARPDGLAGSWWLPAKEVKLQVEWSSPIDSLMVDQPVTRTIHLMATGVAEAQLPELDVPVIDNISVYADSPTSATNNSERGLISQQTNTWAVIPQIAGQLVLPEVRVNWFDTQTGEARVAVLPEETLSVTAAVGTAQSNDASAVRAQNNTGVQSGITPDNRDTDALGDNGGAQQIPNDFNTPLAESDAVAQMSSVANAQLVQSEIRWRRIATALLVGWVLSMLAIWFWWRAQHREKTLNSVATQDETELEAHRLVRRAGSRAALEPLKVACESGDASKIAKSVFSWASMVWPESPPTNLADVAQRLESSALAQTFDGINAQLYRSAGSVNPVAVESIPELIKQAIDQYQKAEPVIAKSNGLPSL